MTLIEKRLKRRVKKVRDQSVPNSLTDKAHPSTVPAIEEPTSSTAKRRRVVVQEKTSEAEEGSNSEAVSKEAHEDGPTWVLISNLRRPFTLNMLRAMVEEVSLALTTRSP